MIDLERLIIQPGDTVKSNANFFELEAREFIVKEVKIVNLIPMVYPEVGHPVPASELIVVKKAGEMTLQDKNKIVIGELLTRAFGDNWDIVPFIDRATKIANFPSHGPNVSHILLVRFPEFDIKNSKGRQHKIRDLITGIPLLSSYRILSGHIWGIRTTFTSAEQAVSYVHSHLSSGGEFPGWSDFCLGSGIIRESMLIAQGCDPSVNPFAYDLFFENLDAYVRWESLEGGPYNRMEYITNSGVYTGSINLSQNTKNSFMKWLRDNNYQFPISINSNIKSFKDFKSIVSIDEKILKDNLKDLIISNFDNISKTIPSSLLYEILVANNNGSQVRISRNSSLEFLKDVLFNNSTEENEISIVDCGKSNLYFRGEELRRKKIVSKNDRIKVQDVEINNMLISSLINNFNRKIYGYIFKYEDNFKDTVINYKTGV